jgi:hypothetical protein
MDDQTQTIVISEGMVVCATLPEEDHPCQAQSTLVLPVCQQHVQVELVEISVDHKEQPDPTTYEVIEGGSQKGRPKLADSNGFTYVVRKKKANGNKLWTCTVRNKTVACWATVLQNEDRFVRGPREHVHVPQPGAAIATKIRTAVKKSASEEMFTPVVDIVHKALEEASITSVLLPALPKPDRFVRVANRLRQKLRTQEVASALGNTNMEFNNVETPAPARDAFVRSDIHVDGKQHLIFASDKMLQVLCKSKTWYMNGVFKSVEEPFIQLLTVRAVVLNGEATKQVPLLFVLMSGKRRRDYKRVLKAIKRLSNGRKVEKIMIDFDSALCTAIPLVFSEVRISGCPLDFSYCIWRRMQELGLSEAYKNDNAIHNICTQLMAIPCLPVIHITAVFEKLAIKATPVLDELMDYVRENWIDGTLWKPSVWSVFNEPIHTNNDVTNWYGILQQHTKDNKISFDPLIQLLREKAKRVGSNVHLLSDKKLKKKQSREHEQVQVQVFDLWASYIAGDKSAKKLLRRIACIWNHFPLITIT